MRATRNIFGLFLMVGAFAFLATFSTSCSEDNPLGSEKLIGNLGDSTFVEAGTFLTGQAFGAEATYWFNGVFDSIPGYSAVYPRLDINDERLYRALIIDTPVVISYSITVDSANWWYVFSVTAVHGIDTADVIDSVQLSGPNGPGSPFALGDALNSIKFRAHVQVRANNSIEFVGSIGAHAALDISIVSTDTINGILVNTLSTNLSAFDTLTGTSSDSDGTCDITSSSEKTATDLISKDSPDADCPESGAINLSATLNLSCYNVAQTDTLLINGSWTVGITFTGGGAADVVFENETTRWTQTVNCGAFAQPSPLRRLRFGSLRN